MPLKQLISRKTSLSILLGVAALAAIMLFSGSGHSRAEPHAAANAPLPEVTVAEVIHRPLREWQEFSGRLQAPNTVEIHPRVNGFIDRVAFTDGARVKKGQLLMVLDAPELEQAVIQAKEKYARTVSDYAISRDNYERLVQAARTPGADGGC